MKRYKLFLSNDFHGTKTSVMAQSGLQISSGQARRIERDLCGRDGCTCGRDGIGMRGGQFIATEQQDGTYSLFSRV